MKHLLKEVNREHLCNVCKNYGHKVLKETGKFPNGKELTEWAVKTYKEKEDAVDFVQFEGTKRERVVKRHLAVLNE